MGPSALTMAWKSSLRRRLIHVRVAEVVPLRRREGNGPLMLYRFAQRLSRQLPSAARASNRVKFTLLTAGVALLTTAAIPALTVAAPAVHQFVGSGTAQGSWLVQFRGDVSDSAAARIVSASGATEIGQIDEIGAHVLNIPAGRQSQVVTALQHDPRVVSLEQDSTVQASVVPNDPHWTQAWGPRLVRAPVAWNMTTGSAKTVIAIVDTGVDPSQPDLRGRVLRGWDFVGNDARANDDNGHGTAVAGVAAAAADNGVGIAGICWRCEILPVKVLNAAGSGTHSNIAAGIVWATDHGADVINMSLAGPTPSAIIANAVAYARNHGVVVVAAAGNEGSGQRFYPAALPGVISVGATNSNDNLYSWSNRGSWVKLSAPGCAYTGSTGPIRWTWWCGTSFATPVIAGIAALIKSERPNISRAGIEQALLHSTVRVRGVVDGRIDAARAVRAASSGNPGSSDPTPTPTQKPSPTSTQQTDTWHGHVDGDTQRDSHTFRLSGSVQVGVAWSSGVTLWVRIADADNHTVAVFHGDRGQLNWSGSVQSGSYTITVGQFADAGTSFTVTIRD